MTPDAYPVLIAVFAFLFFLIGNFLSCFIFKYKTNTPGRFQRKNLIRAYPQHNYLIAILLASVLLCIAGLYLYEGVPPLVKAIAGLARGESGEEMALSVGTARKHISKAHYFGGKYRGQGVIKEFMRIGWPFLLALSLLLFYKTKKFLWIGISSVLFLCTFVFVAGDGTRGPILFCIIYLFIVMSLVVKIKFRLVPLIIAGIFFIAMGISFLSPKLHWMLEKESVVIPASKRIANRIFLGNGIDNIYVIEFIRSGELDYRGGSVHLQKIINSMPGIRYGVPFPRELNQLIHPHKKSTFYSSMTYLGTVYVDFGLIGIIIIYFFLGVIIAFAQVIIFTRKKRLLELPLIAFALFYLGYMSINGPVGFIASFVVVLVCYFVIKFCIEIQYFALKKIPQRK